MLTTKRDIRIFTKVNTFVARHKTVVRHVWRFLPPAAGDKRGGNKKAFFGPLLLFLSSTQQYSLRGEGGGIPPSITYLYMPKVSFLSRTCEGQGTAKRRERFHIINNNFTVNPHIIYLRSLKNSFFHINIVYSKSLWAL